MARSIASVIGAAALALLLSAASARADEIKLKDGSKITGTFAVAILRAPNRFAARSPARLPQSRRNPAACLP